MGTRGDAGSVRALARKRQTRRGSAKAEALRPIPTSHEIPHEPLIDAVAERVADGSVLRLIRLFLGALIQDGWRLVRPTAGTPQGGVASPLLANIYLAKLDRALDADGIEYVRYADDVRLVSRTAA